MKLSIGDRVKIGKEISSLKREAYRKLSGKVGVIKDIIPFREGAFYSIFFPEVWNNSTFNQDPIENLCFHLWESELEAAD